MGKSVIKGYAVKKLILTLTLLFVLIAVSESVAAEFETFSGESRVGIEINLMKTDHDDTSGLITFNHIASLKEAFPRGIVSFSTQADSFLSRGTVSLPVRVFLTDEAYPSFSG